MRITCPACNASYDVPDAMLGVGRSVRCARCLREWQPQPAPVSADEPASPAPAPDAPAFGTPASGTPAFEPPAFETDGFVLPEPERPRFTAEDLDRSPAPRPSGDAHAWRDVLLAQNGRPEPAETGRRDGWVGWLASLVLLLALAGAAIAGRGAVQRAWPPSTRVYAALGLKQGRPEALPLDSAKGSPLESTTR